MSEDWYSRARGAEDDKTERWAPRLRCSALSSIFWKVWFCETLSHPASARPPALESPMSAARREMSSRFMACSFGVLRPDGKPAGDHRAHLVDGTRDDH